MLVITKKLTLSWEHLIDGPEYLHKLWRPKEIFVKRTIRYDYMPCAEDKPDGFCTELPEVAVCRTEYTGCIVFSTMTRNIDLRCMWVKMKRERL